MRQNRRLCRLTAATAVAALLWNTAFEAAAQPTAPPLPQPGQGRPDLAQADPPDRVGRIARLSGTVSFHNPGDSDWTAAGVNYPVTSGNSFWSAPGAEAQLEIGETRILLAGATEFDVTTLDATGLQAVARQGEAFIDLRGPTPNEGWTVQTPRSLVRLTGRGRYAIAAGDTTQPTTITVVEGAAQVSGPGLSIQLTANQTATITGSDTFQGTIGPAVHDAFLTQALNAGQTPRLPIVNAPALVAALPGGNDLLQEGNWSDAPDYGPVWYPPVAAGWVPYRSGHWAFVAPWGWTWIDAAPWGFAPFHYGRWVEIGGRWAWTPGTFAVARPPVYAPALVAFVGLGTGAALAARSISWVPLGPREPFRPWYHASNRYLRDVNANHLTVVNNQVVVNSFVNQAAATSIPATAMTASRPVQAVARPLTTNEFTLVRPIIGQQPVSPTNATAGVTPTIAHRLNLAPAGIRAPGPLLHPEMTGPAGFARPTPAPTANPSVAPMPRTDILTGARPAGLPTIQRLNHPDILHPDPDQSVLAGTRSARLPTIQHPNHPEVSHPGQTGIAPTHLEPFRTATQPLLGQPPPLSAPTARAGIPHVMTAAPPTGNPPQRGFAPSANTPRIVAQTPRMEPPRAAPPLRMEPPHITPSAPHTAPQPAARPQGPQHSGLPGQR